MTRHIFLALCALPLLAGCQTNSGWERLNFIRDMRMPFVMQQMAASEVKLTPGAPTYIRIFKEEGVLETWVRSEETAKYHLYKTYPICKWSGALGPKLAEGDKQAPEGFYDVTMDWLWPGSQYHLAMNIGYPNQYDRTHGRTGSYIMIHGKCFSEGCFAMKDRPIEEIYLLTERSLLAGNHNVPIHIFPFRMTDENMARHADSPWTPFWRNLRQGYEWFERSRVPPETAVHNGVYVFKERRFMTAGGNV